MVSAISIAAVSPRMHGTSSHDVMAHSGHRPPWSYYYSRFISRGRINVTARQSPHRFNFDRGRWLSLIHWSTSYSPHARHGLLSSSGELPKDYSGREDFFADGECSLATDSHRACR